MDNFLRRLRGTLGMALVWGAGWAAVVGLIPGGLSWLEAVVVVVRVGIVGAVAGVAFSPVISLLYRERRLSEIGWVRFGLGGALVTGVAVPLFLQTMNLLGGEGLVPWALVLDDALFTAFIGGVAAGGSLKLAQVGDRLALAHRAGPGNRGRAGADHRGTSERAALGMAPPRPTARPRRMRRDQDRLL